ncbi:MAG: hypothetical protein QOF51_3982 [Chloroflexota bacterium]|jgi:hypothetical protein|nr:hypothetical protein [Chloroflexota bacterium]
MHKVRLLSILSAGVLAVSVFGGVSQAASPVADDQVIVMDRHGADDPAGDDRGGRAVHRHGADDAAGHDAGDDRGGRR